MILSDKRVKECEFQIKKVMYLVDEWIHEVAALRMRIKALEEKPPITGTVHVNKPFGYKYYFTFTNPDGTENGGFFTDPKALGSISSLVYSMGGRDLVIRDQTIVTESPT